MNFTGVDFTVIPDNSFAYIAFDLEYGFRLLEERRDLNAVYFRDLADADPDGISNTAVTTQGLIIKSSLVAYNGSLGPLEDRVGELIKIGDTWATVLLYNSDRSVVVDNYPTKLPPIQSIQNNLINVPLHGLANNDPIQFSGPTPPIGITEGTTYYVRNPTTNSFNISATSGGGNITLVDRAGELHVSKLYSVFLPTLNYDVIKDTIIGKVIRTGNFYTVETFYNVSGESITSFELVEALPALGAYEGQVVLYENTIYTWNGVSWATASGASSRTVSLSVTQQAFDYTSNGSKVGTPTSTVTATAFGTTGALTYVFKLDGTVVTGSGNTYDYTPNTSFDAMPDIVTVDLYEDGLLVASDLITMFGVIEGGDAITIVLSNEAHTIPTNSAGNNGVFTGSGTSIQVFRGNTALSYVSGSSASSFDITTIANTNVSGATTRPTTAVIPDITGISASTGFRDITIIVYSTNSSGTVVSQTFNKVQSFSRSVAGVDGANSQTVTVTGEQAFKFLAGSATPVSSPIVLTASLAGGLTTYNWQYWNGNDWVNLSDPQNASTYSLAFNNAAFTGESIRIRCLSGSLFDEITVVKLRDGTNAISAYLTNETHTVSSLADGTGYSLATAGGNFVVFNGTSDATGTATLSIVGGSGTTTLTKVQNGLTLSLVEATGVYTLSGASWTTDSETFTLRAVLNGVTIDKVYTISKSKAGAAGAGSQTVTVTGEQAFKFLAGSATPVSSSIVLTASLAGGLTTYNWQYWNGNDWVNLSDPQNASTYSLAFNNAAFTGESIRIRCLSGSLFDEITIVKLRDGAAGTNAISAYLTNETHTVSSLVDGTGYSLTTAGGSFVVFNGITDSTGTATLSIVGGSGTTTLTKVQNGLTLSLVEATGVYTLSGASWITDSETFTLRAVLNGVTIDKVYTITKSKAGAAGGTGPTGSTGTQALIAYAIGESNYVFTGSNIVIGALTSPPANASIVYNFASGVEGFTASGGSLVSQSSDTLTWIAGTTDSNLLSPTLGVPGASISKIRIRLRATSANPTWEGLIYYATSGHGYSGSFYGVIPAPATPIVQNTYYIVEADMSNLGVNGGTDWINSTIDSIRFDITSDPSTVVTAILSNEAHTVPTDSAGNNGNFTDSGTTIKVYEGASELIYETGDGFPTINNRFRIVPAVSSIAVGAISGSGTTTATVANASNMAQNTATITYTINTRTSIGQNIAITKIQSFNKSRADVTGINGADGADGAAGINAKAVKLTATAQVVEYNSANNRVAPASIIFTATPQNTTVSTYRFFVNNVAQGAASSTATFTYNTSATYVSAPVIIEVELYDSAVLVARDQVSVYAIKPGPNWEIDWIALGSSFSGNMPASGNWGLTTSWTPTPQTLTTNGTSLYQVTGLFNPATNQTIWTGYPYLSSLKVGSLSAITATIGTLRTATSGPRTEIKDNLIEIYDAVRLRVRLGVWT